MRKDIRYADTIGIEAEPIVLPAAEAHGVPGAVFFDDDALVLLKQIVDLRRIVANLLLQKFQNEGRLGLTHLQQDVAVMHYGPVRVFRLMAVPVDTRL